MASVKRHSSCTRQTTIRKHTIRKHGIAAAAATAAAARFTADVLERDALYDTARIHKRHDTQPQSTMSGATAQQSHAPHRQQTPTKCIAAIKHLTPHHT
jgi:hypothetical protein